MPTPEITAEYDQLVAEFDEAASRPDWPGHRVLSDDGELIANHVDDIELPDWADGDGIELPDWADGDGIELPAWASLDKDTTQEATNSPQKANQEQGEQKIEKAVVVSYRAMHKRVRAERGPASEQACVDCGGQASEWSYTHQGGINELEADDDEHAGMHYSTSIDDYQPRCRSCHRTHDKRAARARRAEPTPPAEGWTGMTNPIEAGWEIRRALRAMGGMAAPSPVDEVAEYLRAYIGAQYDEDLDTTALWIAGSHLSARGVGSVSPRLAVVAPTKQAGKSNALKIITRLSHKGYRIDAPISDALLGRRFLDHGCITNTFDEVDVTLRPGSTAETIMRSGWDRSAVLPLNIKSAEDGEFHPIDVPIFGPIAMAGNGLPDLREDTLDRIIWCRLVRTPGMPEFIERDEAELLRRLHDRLTAWADEVAGLVKVKRPTILGGFDGRARDRYSILASVAEGTHQRKWREHVVAVAKADAEHRVKMEDAAGKSIHEQLMIDMFDKLPDAEAWLTEKVIGALHNAYPERWGTPSGHPLTGRALADRLNKFYRIAPDRMPRAIDPSRRRGYLRRDLLPHWQALGLTIPEDWME